MAVQTTPRAEVFSITSPYLSSGRTTTFVSRTDLMSVAIKVYSEGGENALHTHAFEDHAFVVLEGEATFFDEEDIPTVVKPYQGIALPRGAYYRFEATGDRNLVLLRFGASVLGKTGDSRLNIDGGPLPSDSAENKQIPGVPIVGKFFGE